MIRDEIKNNLEAIRKDKSLWSGFKHEYHENEHGNDKNGLKRYALILELQYDRKKSDKELLNYLLENEILMHQNSSRQGLFESLNLLVYLVALHKDITDILLFDEAKTANYDTFCGLDSQIFFACGVEATIDFLDSQPGIDENSFLYDLKHDLRDAYSDEEIEEWLSFKADYYPENEEDEDIFDTLEKALTFGDIDAGRKILSTLEKEKDKYNLDDSTLFHYAQSLGEYEKAGHYRKLADKEKERIQKELENM